MTMSIVRSKYPEKLMKNDARRIPDVTVLHHHRLRLEGKHCAGP